MEWDTRLLDTTRTSNRPRSAHRNSTPIMGRYSISSWMSMQGPRRRCRLRTLRNRGIRRAIRLPPNCYLKASARSGATQQTISHGCDAAYSSPVHAEHDRNRWEHRARGCDRDRRNRRRSWTSNDRRPKTKHPMGSKQRRSALHRHIQLSNHLPHLPANG